MASKIMPTPEALSRGAILNTYRQLLRATYIAFKGDARTLTASRKFARDSYDLSRNLEPGSQEADDAFKHVQSVTKILRENVVQGTHKGGEDEQHYKLNIHEHTERGDNATAKKMQGSVKSFKEIKDSMF